MRKTINGHDLREMFGAATLWLEKVAPDINALNVYPVPDGDCGTNMLFTMRASLAEAANVTDNRVSTVAEAMAKGALMGARGNSGVILSQIWRGLAKSLKQKAVINGKGLADALAEAAQTAFHALSNPVEGTILTVVKDVAHAASKEAADKGSVISVLEHSVEAARTSVARTPDLLSVLKEAGVVDAGGHGLYTLLEGALLYLKGDMDNRTPQLVPSSAPLVVKPVPVEVEEEAYGFCTQFLLKGNNLDVAGLRELLLNRGKSVIVVGDNKTIRVHIHTLEPEQVKELAAGMGTLSDIDIRNMDDQHKDFLIMHKEKAARQGVAIVAVVNGDGLASVFSSLGVSAIVPGGQTMNPSTMDLLQAAEAVPSENVIILPNNKNIVLTAQQVQSLTKKHITVIPTETIAQGVTAMVAFTPDADLKFNIAQMNESFANVKTIEITRSARTMRLDGLNIVEGQAIGLLDGKIIAAGDNEEAVILGIFAQVDVSGYGIVSVYYGTLADEAGAQMISRKIKKRYPHFEIEVVDGGQPHYSYIISIE